MSSTSRIYRGRHRFVIALEVPDRKGAGCETRTGYGDFAEGVAAPAQPAQSLRNQDEAAAGIPRRPLMMGLTVSTRPAARCVTRRGRGIPVNQGCPHVKSETVQAV